MLQYIPLFVIWTLAFVSLAAIVFSVGMTIKNIFKGDKRQKIVNLTALLCVLIISVSWFMNFGWYRFAMMLIPLPVVHIGAFLLVCGFAAKHSQGRLDVMLAFAEITFVLAYLLLPDGGDAGELYVLFGQIHGDNIGTVCGAIASTLMKINIVLLILLVIKAKKKTTTVTKEKDN